MSQQFPGFTTRAKCILPYFAVSYLTAYWAVHTSVERYTSYYSSQIPSTWLWISIWLWAAFAVLMFLNPPIFLYLANIKVIVASEGMIGKKLISKTVNSINWNEMSRVNSSWSFPNPRFVSILRNTRNTFFYFPRSLLKQNGFKETVQKYAPPENPLRKFIEELQK